MTVNFLSRNQDDKKLELATKGCNTNIGQKFNIQLNFCVFAILMLFIAIFAYRNYLFGDKTFIFTTIEDSIGQTYPYHLYYARRIANGEIGPIYNFMDGLGNKSSSIIISLMNWFCYFGEKNVAYLLGVNQTLKVFLAGILAYLFAKVRNGNNITCAIIGIGYAFCTHIIVRQEFISYGVETVVIMLWLLVYEYSYVKNRIFFIPIITWMTFYYLDSIPIILWASTFVVFIILDGFTNDRIKFSIVNTIKYEIAFIGTFLYFYAENTYNFIRAGLTSTRFEKTVSNSILNTVGMFSSNANDFSASDISIFDRLKEFFANNIEKPYALCAYIMRTVGMSIYDTAEKYIGGKASYLVDGGFYCGIVAVLIIPYALFKMSKRKRTVYILAYVATFVYIGVVPFRFLANGYSCPGFRFSCLRIILLILITAIEGFNLFFSTENKGKYDAAIISFTWMSLSVIMVYVLVSGKVQKINYWIISELFISIYTFVLISFLKGIITKRFITVLLLALVSTEVVAVSWDYINNRYTLMKDGKAEKIAEYADERAYDDGTIEAIEYIKKHDDSWYRIEKDYLSVFLEDPLAQNYYGTTVYVAGLGIGEDFVKMSDVFSLNLRGTDPYFGNMGNVYTQSLFAVKYVLSRNKELNIYGMTYVDTVGDINIFRNELALPIAYVSKSGIHLEDILKLSDLDRQRILLTTCIIEDETLSFGKNENPIEEVMGLVEECDEKDIDSMSDSEVLLTGVNPYGEDVVIYYSNNKNGETVRKGAHARSEDQIYFENIGACKKNSLYMAHPYGEIAYDGLKYNFYKADANRYYNDVVEGVYDFQKNGLVVLKHDPYSITGKINSDSDGMLVTSIPYDSPFSVYIDGKLAEKEKVNLYFIGTPISKGEHTVEFLYQTDNSFWGVYKSIVYILIKLLVAGIVLEIINSLLKNKSKLLK